MHILVIGAGVVGAATTLELADRGLDVTLIDAEHEAGLGTSYANGSGITPGHAEPWNPPGTGRRLIGALFGRNQPYRVRFGALPGLFGWGLAFLRESSADRYYANAAHCIRLAVHSGERLVALRNRHALEYDQVVEGSLELYRTPADLDEAIELRRRIDNPDVRFDVLSPDELERIEPGLAPVAAQFHAALHFPAHESGDARAFSREAVRRAVELGATAKLDTAVRSIQARPEKSPKIATDEGMIEADHVILCTGTGTDTLLRPLGLRVPIYPVQGYSTTIPVAPDGPAPRLPILDLERRFVTARLGPERLRIAGLADFSGGDRRIHADRIRQLQEGASALFPKLRDALLSNRGETWTGLRPMTPDGPPLIGPTPIDGLWLNAGHGAMGWTMAAGSADVLADLLEGKTPGIDVTGLEARRAFG